MASRLAAAAALRPLARQRPLSASAFRPRTLDTLYRQQPPLQRAAALQFRLYASQSEKAAEDNKVKGSGPAGDQAGTSAPRTRDPPSKSFSEMGENAKHEAKNVAGSVLESVGGSGGKRGGVEQGSSSEVMTDLKSMDSLLETVPRGAITFGALGLIPYVATSATTMYLARGVWLSDQGVDLPVDQETALALLYHNESLQVAYGAVILSFLGAIHWGMEFSGRGGYQGTPRYLLGIFPVALAWPTVLLPGQIALATQWAAFTAVWYADMWATQKGWTPRWYSTYRFGLTAIVGGFILLTLGATNYWAPKSAGALTTGEKLRKLQAQQKGTTSEDEGGPGGIKISGSLAAGGPMASSSGDDAFVKFSNIEEKKKKEEEERQKTAEEAKKAAEANRDKKQDKK